MASPKTNQANGAVEVMETFEEGDSTETIPLTTRIKYWHCHEVRTDLPLLRPHTLGPR